MSATPLQLNLEPTANECYQRKVQALTDVVTRYSPRFYRIAANRLSNMADAEDAVQDALLLALRRAAVQGASEDVHVADDDRNQFCTNETT